MRDKRVVESELDDAGDDEAEAASRVASLEDELKAIEAAEDADA